MGVLKVKVKVKVEVKTKPEVFALRAG